MLLHWVRESPYQACTTVLILHYALLTAAFVAFSLDEAIGRVAGNSGIRPSSQETQDGVQMTRGNPFLAMLLTLTNSGTFVSTCYCSKVCSICILLFILYVFA